MNTFPTLSTGLDISGFSDEPSDNAVRIASTASGYPVINELFTFDPRTFSGTLSNVSETDKQTVMAFYEANKGVPFYWLNEQDDTVYEVCFASKPRPSIMDGDDKTKWRIPLTFLQTAAIEYPSTFLSRQFYGGDVMIEVVNLAAGADISNMPVFVAAQDMNLLSCHLLTKGTPTGIDDNNTVVITIKNAAGNTIATKTFNAGTQPPTNDSEDWSSLLYEDYTTLLEGDVLFLTVTQGTTANMPAFSITFGGYYS